MKTLIVIVGPTGVGKTALCLDVAELFDTAIVNADSRQMFKEIPIGTAAPTKDEQKRVKHYFVGNLSIEDYYNASMFENDVISLLERLFQEKDIVIMSGGSMMYVDAVCNGIDDIPTVKDDIRYAVKEAYDKNGLNALCKELENLEKMLVQCEPIMNIEARLVVMSYHSLEDRLVKNYMKYGNCEGEIKKDFYGNISNGLRMLTKKPVTANEEELCANPRSRSAKLRIAEKNK